MKPYDIDRHHIIPKSRGGSNNSNNIKMLQVNTHRALHYLFHNDTPVEQVERLINLNWNALTQDFKSDLIDIFQESDVDYYYKQEVLKNKKIRPQKKNKFN